MPQPSKPLETYEFLQPLQPNPAVNRTLRDEAAQRRLLLTLKL